jgi:TRAP-type C4-dicarboxylate transport system permease small subunit
MIQVQKASAAVDRVCLMVSKLALVALVLTVLLQIWARYGFAYPFSWTEELARYLMVWAGLLGATCAFRRRLDPAVVSAEPGGPGLAGNARRTLLAATVLIFLLPVLYHSVFGPGMNIERGFLWRSSGRVSPGLGLNMALVGSIVPISCTVLLLHLAARLGERSGPK